VIQQIRTMDIPAGEWKLPLNIAIGLHALVVIGALYLPGLFEAKPKFADIYTVSLITVAEPVATPPPAKSEEISEPLPVAKPVVKPKKVAPIAEVAEKTTPVPAKAISLKPFKRKKIKKKKRVDTTSRRKNLERRKRRQLAAALRAEELLAENAKRAQEALENERNLLKPVKRQSSKNQATSTPATTSLASSRIVGSSSLISSRYNSAIASRLLQFWSLPEFMQKNTSLNAVVVITIKKNGKIANMFFESKSGNRVFDQFVNKAIEAANPLPPIPPAMKKQRYEIGLRFRPGSIK